MPISRAYFISMNRFGPPALGYVHAETDSTDEQESAAEAFLIPAQSTAKDGEVFGKFLYVERPRPEGVMFKAALAVLEDHVWAVVRALPSDQRPMQVLFVDADLEMVSARMTLGCYPGLPRVATLAKTNQVRTFAGQIGAIRGL
jgi:hypothetical protein